MTDRGRLLRPEEIGVEGHLLMVRRHGGTGGRPPREGELLEPNPAELHDAGWRGRPPREAPTPVPDDGLTVAQIVESRRFERQLEKLDAELAMATNSSKSARAAGNRPLAKIRRDIEAVQAAIAEVKAAHVPTAEEKREAKAAAKRGLAAAFHGGRMMPREAA